MYTMLEQPSPSIVAALARSRYTGLYVLCVLGPPRALYIQAPAGHTATSLRYHQRLKGDRPELGGHTMRAPARSPGPWKARPHALLQGGLSPPRCPRASLIVRPRRRWCWQAGSGCRLVPTLPYQVLNTGPCHPRPRHLRRRLHATCRAKRAMLCSSCVSSSLNPNPKPLNPRTLKIFSKYFYFMSAPCLCCPGQPPSGRCP